MRESGEEEGEKEAAWEGHVWLVEQEVVKFAVCSVEEIESMVVGWTPWTTAYILLRRCD